MAAKRDGTPPFILTPSRVGAADAARRRLAELGITEADAAEAVAWARRASDPPGA